MIYWINGPYGVGKSTLASKLHEINSNSFIFDAEVVGNAIRDNMPKELFNGYIFEKYNLWFEMIFKLLKEITHKFDGDIYIPMTLVYEDSFNKIEKLLKKSNIEIKHILLESTYEVVKERILKRGESEDCWCIMNIGLCIENQSKFNNVVRIKSTNKSVNELAQIILKLF